MAELLKRTFPIPMGAVICCGKCNIELWKAKRDIPGKPIDRAMLESHIRQAPQEGEIIACPSCHALLPDQHGHVYWKMPIR